MYKHTEQLVLQGFRISVPSLKSYSNDLLEQAFQKDFDLKTDDESFIESIVPAMFPNLAINDQNGNLLIGERFQMILKLLNIGNKDCNSVTITVDLNAERMSYRLYESPIDLKIPAYGKHIFVVNHAISFSAQYSMCCTIKGTVEKRSVSLKRTYNFNVVKPFEITARSNFLNNTNFVQVSITNSSDKPLTLLDSQLNQVGVKWSILTPKNGNFLQFLKPLDTFNLILKIEESADDSNQSLIKFSQSENLYRGEDAYPNNYTQSSTPESLDRLIGPDSTVFLSLDWQADSKGICKYIAELELEDKRPKITFRAIKTPSIINVPVYLDVKFEIRNEGADNAYCKIVLGEFCHDETVESPIQSGLTITQTYTLHFHRKGLLSLDSIKLLVWPPSRSYTKEYLLLDPPSILCI